MTIDQVDRGWGPALAWARGGGCGLAESGLVPMIMVLLRATRSPRTSARRTRRRAMRERVSVRRGCVEAAAESLRMKPRRGGGGCSA